MSEIKSDVPLVIWHGGCLDGFMSAYLVWEYFKGNVELFAGKYQEDPPGVRDRDVIIVDFSYKRGPMEEMHARANSITVLDHHKTAEQELQPWIRAWPAKPPLLFEKGFCSAYFDMNRSGAGMTWDFFYPDLERHVLVDAVEDRDLWRFNKPFTKEWCTALYSLDFDPKVFQQVMNETMVGNDMLARLVDEGAAIMRAEAKNRAAIIAEGVRYRLLGGVQMPVVNAPWWMASEVGNDLAASHDCKCGGTWWFDKDGKAAYSLRSIEGGPDVSEIAKQYGGGGHKHAAGFKIGGGAL